MCQATDICLRVWRGTPLDKQDACPLPPPPPSGHNKKSPSPDKVIPYTRAPLPLGGGGFRRGNAGVNGLCLDKQGKTTNNPPPPGQILEWGGCPYCLLGMGGFGGRYDDFDKP